MKVSELIEKLQALAPDTTVVGTWEGIFADIHVYTASDGTVLLDVDGESYKARFQSPDWRGRMVTR